MTKLSSTQLINLSLLLSIEGIGPGKIRNLLSKFHTVENILSSGLNSLMEVEGISTNLANRLRRAKSLYPEIEKKFLTGLEKLNRLGGRIITVWDEDYPPLLKKIYDPPLLLYVKGEYTEADRYAVAVVGTRQPTNYGKVLADRIAGDLTRQNITIISGLARGIDSISHQSALNAGGRTIAVIGSGLDVIYPPENARLFEQISENGAVISEYDIGTKPDAQNFPKRNRVISGLSLGTIVIETGVEGGAMQTASLALDQNREVFAVPGNVGIKQSEGTNLLIQKGEAKLIRSAEDVLVELELKLKPVLGKNIPHSAVEMNLFEEKILAAIGGSPLHIDNIASASGMSTSDCLVHLLSLEFKGLVKQLPGKMFARL